MYYEFLCVINITSSSGERFHCNFFSASVNCVTIGGQLSIFVEVLSSTEDRRYSTCVCVYIYIYIYIYIYVYVYIYIYAK
jgi:hypothetical protein